MNLNGSPAQSTPSWPKYTKYQNQTDFHRTVHMVVVGLKIRLKAIFHLFSMLNLIFSFIFDESQRYACTVHTKLAKIHQILQPSQQTNENQSIFWYFPYFGQVWKRLCRKNEHIGKIYV